ncbi:MAG: hypothetical protein ACRESZ_00235 [Methylococcales bacterium]
MIKNPVIYLLRSLPAIKITARLPRIVIPVSRDMSSYAVTKSFGDFMLRGGFRFYPEEPQASRQKHGCQAPACVLMTPFSESGLRKSFEAGPIDTLFTPSLAKLATSIPACSYLLYIHQLR